MVLEEDRKPSKTDYIAASALAYAIVYFWLHSVAGMPSSLSYVVFFLTGLVPSYLVCTRADSAFLAVGIKAALISWAFTSVAILAFVEESSLAFFGVLLFCQVTGGATAAYLAQKRSFSQPR